MEYLKIYKFLGNYISISGKRMTQRMCIDYRKLNGVTVNDLYPLNNIEQLIAYLGVSKYINTFDLTKG